MIKTESKDIFWNVVKECLMAFHEFPECKAEEKTLELRQRLEEHPVGMSIDIVYHSEPYNIACNIAGQEKDILEDHEKYQKILLKNNW